MSALPIERIGPPPAKPARVELPGRLAFSEVANDVLEVLAGRTDFLTTLNLHRALDCRRQYHGLSTLSTP